MAEGARSSLPAPVTVRIDTGVRVAGEAKALGVAAEVFRPATPGAVALLCLSGGNMNRRYFDLIPPDSDDDSFSFARQMARRGFTVVTLDYPGLGDSDRPADGYALTTDVLVRACARVRDEVVASLPGGTQTVGVGHSMGAMLTTVQQATYHQHAAIALLGFSTRGLPEYLPAAARGLDPASAREKVVELARAAFVVPYPMIKGGGNTQLYGSATVDPSGVAAIKRASEHLLPVPAFQSMLPGNVAPEAAAIDVPLFLGIGERDMVGPPEDVAGAFPRAAGVHLQVLPETGHSHFLFASRAQLFDALAQWVRDVTQKS